MKQITWVLLILVNLDLEVYAASLANSGRSDSCNWSAPSSAYVVNQHLVNELHRFGLRLEDDAEQAKKKLTQMVRQTGVPANAYYIDPALVEPYPTHTCKKDGLATINYKDGERFPTSYMYCFLTSTGTLDDAEQFIEERLTIPREKWISLKSFPGRDSAYGRFLRKTRIGANLRWFESGEYYLKSGDRYYSVMVSVDIKFTMLVLSESTAISLNIFDSTAFVKKQIACENKIVAEDISMY